MVAITALVWGTRRETMPLPAVHAVWWEDEQFPRRVGLPVLSPRLAVLPILV